MEKARAVELFAVRKYEEKSPCMINKVISGWGGRWDLNPRPPGPQPGALTN